MADGVNLRTISRASDEWIVGRNRTVFTKPQYFAREIVRVLRARCCWRISNADAHVNHAVFAEDDVRCVVALNGRKDVAGIGERVPVPTSAGKSDHPRVIAGRSIRAGWFVVREVNEFVLNES